MLNKNEKSELEHLANQSIILKSTLSSLNSKQKKTLRNKIREKKKKLNKKLTKMKRQQNKDKEMKKKGKTKKKRIRSGSRTDGATNAFEATFGVGASRKKTALKYGVGLLAAGAVTAALLSGDHDGAEEIHNSVTPPHDEPPHDEPPHDEHVIDCKGEWSDCDENCKKTYHVTKEAEHGGDECPHRDGEEDDCTDEECEPQDCEGVWSECDENCERTFNIPEGKNAKNGGKECDYEDGATEPCLDEYRDHQHGYVHNIIERTGSLPVTHHNGIIVPPKVADGEGHCNATKEIGDNCDIEKDSCKPDLQCHEFGFEWPNRDDWSADPNQCGPSLEYVQNNVDTPHAEKSYKVAISDDRPPIETWTTLDDGSYDYRGSFDDDGTEECPTGEFAWQNKEAECKCSYPDGWVIDDTPRDINDELIDIPEGKVWRCIDYNDGWGGQKIDQSIDFDVYDISDNYHDKTLDETKALAPNADIEFENCAPVDSDGDMKFGSHGHMCQGLKGYQSDW